MQRRVVITGLGVVAPNGIGKEDFWDASLSGRSGVRRITRFDASPLQSQIAGEVANFDPEGLGLTPDEIQRTDRCTQLGLAAANLALQDAGLGAIRSLHAPDAKRSRDQAALAHGFQEAPNRPPTLSEAERDRVGVYMGSAMSSVEEGEKLWRQLTSNGTHPPRAMLDKQISATLLLTHASAMMIAAHHQLHGPCTVISTGCSAGADAIGQAFWTIQEGRADRMLAGGTDSAITYAGLDVFCVMGALSKRNHEPPRASRPYDRERDGFVMAEGAGVLVLEEREQALARNAHIYAELITFASSNNAYHMTSLPEDGVPLQNLLAQVLQEAGISPRQLGYINSHGSSTPTNEVVETVAYKAIFGEHAYSIPISSTKSMIGHTQGAASAIETIVATLVLEHQVIPPTINQEFPDPRCDLDYVPNIARPAAVDIALTHSSGFGGVNSALIVARPDWRK